jgi:hypothetical protein
MCPICRYTEIQILVETENERMDTAISMETNAIASTLAQQMGSQDGTAITRTTVLKYGPSRMARYLLRSFDDCFDVCETINHQVQERVERDDIELVFRDIECWAMAVPNTASNVIVGLGIPSAILDDQQITTRPIRPLQFDFSKVPRPAIKRTHKALVIAHDIKSFFDLNAFNHYLRNSEALRAQGLELAAIRKNMRMMIKKRDGIKANFALILTCTVESDDATNSNQSGEESESQA